MSRLFVFGDSFSADIPNNETSAITVTKKVDKKQAWTYSLADKLGVRPYFLSKYGTGLDYTQFKFNEVLPKIKKDKDYIIVCHTSPSRRWFIEKCPHASNFLNYISPDGSLNVDWVEKMISGIKGSETSSNGIASSFQADVGRHYAIYVARQDLENLYGESIITYFRHYQKQGYKIINIPCVQDEYSISFNEDFNTIGNLDAVSRNEFKAKDKERAFTEICQGCDGRINHLSNDNHPVLVDKLYKCFIEKQDLDFTHGFQTGMITKDTWKDYNTLGLSIEKMNI